MNHDDKTLLVNGERYREASSEYVAGVICEQCAFGAKPRLCSAAIHHSPNVFGGDCQSRNVHYVRAAAALAQEKP